MKQYIFLHIPKTAGRTLESILNRNFSNQSQYNLNDWHSVKEKVSRLETLSNKEKESIRLVRGHYQFGLHESLLGDVKYFTFLRNPVDRTISLYKYIKRNPKHHLYTLIKDEGYTISDFLKNKNNEFCNTQSRMIIGNKQMDWENKEEVLQQVNKNLVNYFDFVGSVELFDLSILLLAKKIGLKFVFYEKKNSAPKKDFPLKNSTIKYIESANQIDMELWLNVQQELRTKAEDMFLLKKNLEWLKTKNYFYSKTLGFYRKTRKFLLEKPLLKQ